jgi:23S rRNA maturation mini-RNase III
MVEETAQPIANPYNKRKQWIQGNEEDIEYGMQGADDSLAFMTPKREMVSTMQEPLVDDGEATPDEENTVEQKATHEDDDVVTEEASDKYKKVDYKKRYDDLKRHYDRKLGEWKSKEETLKAEAQAARPQYKAPKTPEDLATFREEYPDVYDVVETVAHLRAEEQLAELKAKVNSLSEREQQLVRRDAEQQLLAAHPDFSEIKESEDFHEWAAEQPEEIQGWIYRNATNAKLASRAIDLYKKDRGIATATETKPKQAQVKKKAEASAAEAVSVKKKASEPSGKDKIWTTSEISRLSVQQYEAMSNELDAAFREGRIVKG